MNALPEGAARLPDRFSPDEVQVEADDAGRFELHHLTPGKWVVDAYRGPSVEVATGARDVLVTAPRR